MPYSKKRKVDEIVYNDRGMYPRKTIRKYQEYVTKPQVKRMISSKTEIKYLDTINATTISYAGSCICLSEVPQGTVNQTDVVRVGDKIKPKSLEMKLVTTVADNTNIFRVIVFVWKMNDTTDVPSPGEILAVVSSANAVNSPYYHDLKNQFTILYDQTRVMGTTATTPNQTLVWKKNFYKKLPTKINYLGGALTGTNNIYALFISDSSASAHPAINYGFRLNYTDS